MHVVRRGLQQLDEGNRRLVIAYWRWLLWTQIVRDLPLALKHAFLTSGFTLFLLALLPSPGALPARGLPAVWAGAFCLALIVVALLPRR